MQSFLMFWMFVFFCVALFLLSNKAPLLLVAVLFSGFGLELTEGCAHAELPKIF